MATTPTPPAPPGPRKRVRKNRKRRRKGDPSATSRGRTDHAHVPTDRSRAVVAALAAAGRTHDEICDYLTYVEKLSCKSSNTLEKRYRIELKTGTTRQILAVSQGLYANAVGAPAQFDAKGNKVRDEIKPVLVAQIFFLKARAGWKDHQTVEIDPNQKPIPVSVSSLNDKQLDELEARLLDKFKRKS